MFYTLAAEPHPGQDGAPRKAILRHQLPRPYLDDTLSSFDTWPFAPLYPNPSLEQYTFPDPEPAQFANAGPPGWQYSASDQLSPRDEGLGISGLPMEDYKLGRYEAYPTWTSYAPRGTGHVMDERNVRSQWSSPLSRQLHFD